MSLNRTSIEWVKNPDGTQGYTWNPITGCNNHIDGMCKGGGFPCYAYRLANGRLKARYLANWNFGLGWEDYKKIPPDELAKRQLDPFYPRFWEDRLEAMLKKTHGKIWPENTYGIFVCDMSDLFGLGVPQDWTEKVLDAIKQRPRHRFYLLTKQPQNLIKFSPFPPNAYLGVSATNQQQFDNAVKYLREVEATVKFISFEPLLERINIDL